MNIIEQIYNGIKRLLLGSTSYFEIRQGSCAFRGRSFVTIYRERVRYPVNIMAIQFLFQGTGVGEYRICVNGNKVFPFADTNPIEPSVLRNFIVPIRVAAGALLEIEVRGSDPNERSVVVLDELDVVEMR